MSELPPIAVIVTCNGGAWLGRAVHSLRSQHVRPAKIIVVVSHPRPVELPPPGADLTVLHCAQPVGFAPAANRGLRAAGDCSVLLLNDDVEAQPGFVSALWAAARTHGPGIYQPRILLAETDASGSRRVDNTGHRLFFDGFNVARERGLEASRSRPPACGQVGAFSGAAVLLTAEVIAATGGFDAELGAFGEDLDLSLRARRRGYHIRFVDGAVVHHALGASYGRTGARKVYWVERNRVRAALRSLPTGAVLTLPLWTAARLSALAVGAALGRGIGAGAGPSGAIAALAGGLAGVAYVPEALRKRSADRAHWTVGEREMWRQLWRHHARPVDILRRPA